MSSKVAQWSSTVHQPADSLQPEPIRMAMGTTPQGCAWHATTTTTTSDGWFTFTAIASSGVASLHGAAIDAGPGLGTWYTRATWLETWDT
jgi:hypothetical protein